MPIKTRIDMLATGIKTPVGIKVAGPDLKVIQKIGEDLEKIIKQVPGTASVFSERVSGGRYIGAAAVVATNLDNLLLSVNIAQADGIRRTATVFLSIQTLAIALALGLSQGLEELPGHWLSYLGILPVSLGVLELFRKVEHEPVPSAIGIVQSAVVLASNSGDSLAVLVVTFSDESEKFDLVTAIGACVAAVALTVGLILLSQRAGIQQYLGPIARKLQPWLMVLVGLIILLDTPIDVQ